MLALALTLALGLCVCVTEKQRDHWLLYVNREIMLRGKLDVETGSEAQNDMFITRHKLWTTVELTSSAGFCLFQPQYSLHGKSPTYEPSGCKTSKMQTCICMFSRINSSCLWRTLSHTCILFCVIYCIIAVQHEELTNEDLMELEAHQKKKKLREIRWRRSNWRDSWHRKWQGDILYLRRHC